MKRDGRVVQRRRGYNRALLDVELEVDRLLTALDFTVSIAGVADDRKWKAAKDTLRRVKFDIINPLRARNK